MVKPVCGGERSQYARCSFETINAHPPIIIACVLDVLGMSEQMLLQLRTFERDRQQEFLPR